MILGGLWHGASMTFVAWGTFHGLILCALPRAGDPRGGPAGQARRRRPAPGAACVLMFHLVCFGWLFFRADNFGAAFSMLNALWAGPAARASVLLPVLVEMTALALIPFLMEVALDGERNLARLARAPVWVQVASYTYLVAMLMFLHASKANAFIYFQF